MRKYVVPAIALTLAAALAGQSLPSAQSAPAASLTVNSLGDAPDALLADGLCADAAGACTLRAAIQQANFDPLGDAIGFSVTGTINLTGALPDLSTNMTISGPGSGLLTVRRDTGGDYRIFTVRAATVAISGLTVSNGRSGPEEFFSVFSGSAGQPGGGIFNSGTLTLTDCGVSNNASSSGLSGVSSKGPPGHGGGIHNEGTLTMSHCDVSNNQTGSGVAAPDKQGNPGGNGGGISNTGVLTMTDCTVTNNLTGSGGTGFGDGFSGGWGGGIANFTDVGHTGTATLTNCNVIGNRTGDGGVSARSSVNTTSGFGGHGGGIFNGATMSLVKSNAGANTTGNGADARPDVVNIAGSGGSGGGVYNDASLTVINSVVSGNSTGTGGASSGVNCSHGNGGDGGGIASPAGTLKLSQNTIVFNQTGLLSEPCGRDGVGGGLYGMGKLRSTIVSNNVVRSPSSAREVFGVGSGFESFGYNYIGIGSGCCFTSTDRHGSVSNPGFNLHLDPVTLVPLPDSVALDAGLARDIDDQPVTTDRRGAARPFDFPSVPPQTGGDDSDIGAFERQSTDPTPTPTPSTVQFTAGTFAATEACAQVNVTVSRSGPSDGTSVVSYVVVNGGATQRGDFTAAAGTITYAPNDTANKTIPVLICDDAYAEGQETAAVQLSAVSGAIIGTPATATLQINDNETADGATNTIDDPRTFACQHYHDFLNRDAVATGDQAGLDFWTNQTASCGSDAGCLSEKRQNVSAAFFLSIEFQQTGFFVIRVNKAAFGDQPGNPRYLPFLAETQRVGRGVAVGQPGSEQRLEANKQAYAEEFVARADFLSAHGSQSAEQYADSLFTNAGVTPTAAERNAAIAAFGGGDTAGRARALRSVAESASVYNKLYNPAFVLLQYFGYLRRNPDNAPDNNFGGYNFWLTKLNQFTQPGEDARNEQVALSRVKRAEMVKAFLVSGEYRGRFLGDPTRGAQFGDISLLRGGRGLREAVARATWFGDGPASRPDGGG